MNQTEEEEIVYNLIADLSLLPNGRNVVVLLEDREDIGFWRQLIQEFAPDLKPYFHFFSSSGKGGLKRFSDHTNNKLLICVDADNDTYHKTHHSDWLHPRPKFIYHTYAHSRENHLIHPRNLTIECEDITYLNHDFQTDFEEISEALFDFLTLWLFCTDIDREDQSEYLKQIGVRFSWDDFKEIIAECFEKFDFEKSQTIEQARMLITEFKETFRGHIRETETIFKDNCLTEWWDEYSEFKNNCSIEAIDTLYFIRGHQAFDDIILRYFNTMVALYSKKQLKNAEKKEDKNQWEKKGNAVHNYRDRLAVSYRNCLFQHSGCRFFDLIKKDFQDDFR